MIHLYVGEGKGKTTAAVGQAIRALGWHQKVLFAQFLKSGESGETLILDKLEDLVFLRPCMRHKGFIWHMNDQELQETKADLLEGFQQITQKIADGDFSMVILDEVLDIVECGFLKESSLFDLISSSPNTIEFILTGRKASARMKENAHYITFMTKEKHPFDQGVKARKGIEY